MESYKINYCQKVFFKSLAKYCKVLMKVLGLSSILYIFIANVTKEMIDLCRYPNL